MAVLARAALRPRRPLETRTDWFRCVAPRPLTGAKLILVVRAQIPARTMDMELPGPVLVAHRHAHDLQVLDRQVIPLVRRTPRAAWARTARRPRPRSVPRRR